MSHVQLEDLRSKNGDVGVKRLMRLRWRFVLPAAGLLLFAVVTYQSVPGYRTCYRYFWWSATPLDSDPLDRRHWGQTPHQHGAGTCDQWDPMSIEKRQGRVSQVLTLTALPAFLVGWFIVDDLALWGVSQVSSFMTSMPPLIATWFYLLGWVVERWEYKLSADTGTTASGTTG